MPLSAILSVRGIGVAERVSTSTRGNFCFSFSFCATPKRCSSSIISRPRSRNLISLPIMRCVPIRKSTLPFSSPFITSFCFAADTNLESISILTGNASILDFAVLKCCIASTVVGTSSAHCLPSVMHLNAARSATSVFPKPTSPHKRRSMGTERSISRLISSEQRS